MVLPPFLFINTICHGINIINPPSCYLSTLAHFVARHSFRPPPSFIVSPSSHLVRQLRWRFLFSHPPYYFVAVSFDKEVEEISQFIALHLSPSLSPTIRTKCQRQKSSVIHHVHCCSSWCCCWFCDTTPDLFLFRTDGVKYELSPSDYSVRSFNTSLHLLFAHFLRVSSSIPAVLAFQFCRRLVAARRLLLNIPSTTVAGLSASLLEEERSVKDRLKN